MAVNSLWIERARLTPLTPPIKKNAYSIGRRRVRWSGRKVRMYTRIHTLASTDKNVGTWLKNRRVEKRNSRLNPELGRQMQVLVDAGKLDWDPGMGTHPANWS